MTKTTIENQSKPYSDKYNTDNAIQKIEDLLYDYELEFGNVICMFIYKKEDHLELSFLTSPNKNIPRLNIKER